MADGQAECPTKAWGPKIKGRRGSSALLDGIKDDWLKESIIVGRQVVTA